MCRNFDLLKEVGKAKKPVLLKRGLATSIQELLRVLQYIHDEQQLQRHVV